MKNLLFFVFILTTFLSYTQNSLNFDGVNDEVQTTYPGVLGTAARTFEAWVYVSTSAPASNLTILDYGSNATGSRNTFLVAGDRSLRYLSGGTNANINTAANVIPTAQWTHVAFVLSNGTGYLYVNGVQSVTGNLSGVSTPSGNENLKIGERVSGGTIRFHGSIDEVRIWNVARTATQIQADMNIEYCTPPVALKAYYKLNEGVAGGTNTTVLTAVDQILGNNGTLINFGLTGTTSNWVSGSGITLAPIYNNQIVGQCPGTTITVGSNTYSTAGTYYDTLQGQSVNGCDSIVITNLTYFTVSNDTVLVDICSGDSVSVDGVNFFFTSGFHVDTVSAVLTGCDSIVTLNLTVNTLPSSSQTYTECDGFAVTVGSNTYTTSGNYIDTIFNAGVNGCDSIVVTNLTVNAPIDLTVTNNTATFTISANNTTASSYQWIDCTTGTPISGETSSTYLVTANGNYAVIITENNCSDTSACTSYANIGLEENVSDIIKVYPNPSNGKVTISNITEVFNRYDLRILNALGQSVSIQTQLASSNVELNIAEKGIYFVEITQGNEIFRRKLIVR